MTPSEWLVLAAGGASILWVNWYFFFAERSAVRAEAGSGGAQRVEVVVQGGYEPAHVRVVQGVPVRIAFDRRETSGCSEEVVIPEFGIRKFLPAHQTTTVEFTPEEQGSYEFTCGMGMLRGRITVEKAEGK